MVVRGNLHSKEALETEGLPTVLLVLLDSVTRQVLLIHTYLRFDADLVCADTLSFDYYVLRREVQK
jgi:hypothetical protein